MQFRVDMIVDVPDDWGSGEVEAFLEDSVMYLAQDNDVDYTISEFIRTEEV